MKFTSLIFALIFCGFLSYSQSNTFPPSGSAGIGTVAPGDHALTIQRNSDNQPSTFAAMLIKNTNPNIPTGSFYNLAGYNVQSGNGHVMGQLMANSGTGMAAPWNFGSGLYITTRSDHPIIFTTGTSNGERLRITSSGNIGIGTNSPQAKLAVNGDVFAKKIRVLQTGWPDYVFAKSFILMPLNKLEEYIKQFRHLPEMPNAKTVAAHGIDVGDNQALLLKKIEELTLYIIEQNKVNEKQQQKIDLLSEKIEALLTK